MLAEPNCNWGSVHESHHGVFPIPYMVSQGLPRNIVPQIECIKIHIESIEHPLPMVIHYYNAGYSLFRLMRRGIW